jgi:hypothetical protein
MTHADEGWRRGFLKASSMLGLALAFGPATIGEAFTDANSKSTEKEAPWPKPVLRNNAAMMQFVRFR